MKDSLALLAAAAAALALPLGAAVTDLTSSLEYLSNPAASRWPSSAQSRQVQDLAPHAGKIFTSGGEWGGNTGPCPCFAVDPHSGAFTNEFDAGTDAIYEFKEFSDGRLYTSAIDIHEGAAHAGHTFRRETNGMWKAYSNCNLGSITNLEGQGFFTHNWDMAEFKSYTFVCGYGISGSTNRCETKMFNASPTLKDCNREMGVSSWKAPGGYTYSAPFGYSIYRRFCAFLPFEDDLFCIPTQPIAWTEIHKWNNWEEWRWDESLGRFTVQTNTWAGLAPGVTETMTNLCDYTGGTDLVQFWHPTKFGSRVLYILGGHDYNITPMAAYSAVVKDHHISATRIDLGSTDVRPFDLFATEDAVYLTAATLSATATVITNSVWKSTDGVNFTELFKFRLSRQASAICYRDGYFYLGMGSNANTKRGWPKVSGTDLSGRIYRVRLPQESKARILADPERLTVAEGAKGVSVAFRLEAAPATNVKLDVTAGSAALVTASPRALTFTPEDWATGKTVTFDIVEDDETTADLTGSLACSAADGSYYPGAVWVSATNNDFRVVEVAPEGLVDLTSPTGTFEAPSTFVVMLPFNDNPNLVQSTNRVCIQSTDFAIVYDFGTATHMDAYGIYNLSGWNQTTRAPRKWTFAGSDDKETWTELDMRRYEENWKAAEYRYYSFSNARKFRYYRLAITGNNGDAFTQFERLEYYSVNPPSDEPDLSTDMPSLLGGSGLSDSSAQSFGVRVGNVKAGFYYTVFVAEHLGDPFAAAESRRATAENLDTGLTFDLDTTQHASLFVKVVVSAAALPVGTVL